MGEPDQQTLGYKKEVSIQRGTMGDKAIINTLEIYIKTKGGTK
jgi:hypothetical protein